jgi:hypothetical protein
MSDAFNVDGRPVSLKDYHEARTGRDESLDFFQVIGGQSDWRHAGGIVSRTPRKGSGIGAATSLRNSLAPIGYRCSWWDRISESCEQLPECLASSLHHA